MSQRILPMSTASRAAARLKAATLAALRELDSCRTIAQLEQLDGYRVRGTVLLRLAGRGQQREIVVP